MRMPAPVRVSVADAESFLRDRYGDGIRDVAPVAQQGLWSSTFRFHDGKADRIVRFGPSRESLDRDRFVSRHASARLPVPRIREIGAALGAHFAVSDFAAGHPLDGISGEELRRTLPSLLLALDAVREVDLSGSTGYGYFDATGHGIDDSWEYVLLGGVPRWRAAVAASPVGLAAFDAGVARMTELAQYSPSLRHLIHGDLLFHNVLVEGGRVTALLDWGSGFIGDFVYDVAWLAFWGPWHRSWAGIDFGAEAQAHYASIGLTVESFAERRRCYELRIGLSTQEWFAIRGEREHLEWAARRTLELAAGDVA